MILAHGKVILVGEHAVVHGQPALAGALGLGVTATAAPADAWRLEVPAWGIDTARAPEGAPTRALAALAAALEGLRGAWAVRAEATVPPRAGLGSSAALAVAAARALAEAAGLAADVRAIEAAADAAERIFHGNPSGVDVALAARGGIGLYRRGVGLQPIAAAPFRLAIGLSGEPRDTAARVADVARRLAAEPEATGRHLARLGELALAGAEHVAAAAPARLGPLFDEAHAHLVALGLSTSALDRLCALARGAGAAGAKLTGAGGGGAVIAVGAEDAVAAAWRAAGFTALVAEVGAR